MIRLWMEEARVVLRNLYWERIAPPSKGVQQFLDSCQEFLNTLATSELMILQIKSAWTPVARALDIMSIVIGSRLHCQLDDLPVDELVLTAFLQDVLPRMSDDARQQYGRAVVVVRTFLYSRTGDTEEFRRELEYLTSLAEGDAVLTRVRDNIVVSWKGTPRFLQLAGQRLDPDPNWLRQQTEAKGTLLRAILKVLGWGR